MPAPQRRKKPTLFGSQPTKADPAANEELGDDDWSTNYNNRTGRPIRQSAGRKSIDEGFTNTIEAISDDDSLSEEDPDEPRPRPKKRKRTPSPPMTPRQLTDDNYMFQPDGHRAQSTIDVEPENNTYIAPICLTFNVPKNHSGPFVVNLDVNNLVRQSRVSGASSPSPQPSHGSRSGSGNGAIPRSNSVQGKVGFLSLPAELRNEVYRLVFVNESKFDFGSPRNFQHSASLLQTCQQINSEGSSILYSENIFYLRRNSRSRTPRWTTEGREIGFKDLHLFLKSIGPYNISLLRHVVLLLEDAVPSLNPHLTTAEERRFVQDDYLMACLKLLAVHGRLRTLELAPFGRRNVGESDFRFISHLKDIKADTIKFINHPEYPNVYVSQVHPKILHYMEIDLSKSMTRKHRLYAEDMPKKEPEKTTRSYDCSCAPRH